MRFFLLADNLTLIVPKIQLNFLLNATSLLDFPEVCQIMKGREWSNSTHLEIQISTCFGWQKNTLKALTILCLPRKI